MPETLMPLLTGLFLVFAGMLIGYFLWFRDRTQEEATRLRLKTENDDLNNSLRKYKSEHKTITNELSSQKGKLHMLQELCDDLANGREQLQLDRAGLESNISVQRSRIEELQSHLAEEKCQRISLEDQLHSQRQQLTETLGEKERHWSDQHSKLQTELLHRTTDIKQLTGVNDRTTEKLHAAEASIAELKSELSTQRSLLDAARQNENGLEKEYVSLETTLKNHNELLKESRGQCAAALSAKKLAEEIVQDLRKQVEDQKSMLSRMDEALSASESTKLRCLSLEQSLENSEDRLKQLATERDKAMAAEATAHESISALQTRIQNQEMTIRQSRGKADELAINLRDATETRLKIESSAKDIQYQLQIEIKELQRRIEIVQRERDDHASKFDALEQSNLEGASVLEERLSDIVSLKRNREKLATQIATMEQHQKIGEARFEERLVDLRSIQGERDELATKLAALREDKDRGEKGLEQRIAELRELRTERDDLARRLARLEVDLADLKESSLYVREESQTRINMLIAQRDQAFTDVKDLQRKIDALRAEIDEFKQSQTDPMIIAGRFGEEIDEEYRGRTRRHETRGVIYVQAPESPDDLKRISGIAEVLEKRLNDYGVYTFKQIMEWEEETVQEFCTLLAFKDRIDRDDWIGQARKLYRQKQREKHAA